MTVETARDLPRLPDAPLLPGGRGLGGHLGEIARDPLGLLSRARDHAPISRLRFGAFRVLVVSDPAAIQRVLVSEASTYQKTTRSYGVLRLLLGDGLVTSRGETWLRNRRIAQPAFLRKRVAGLADRMVQASLDLAERWQAQPGEIDVHEAMNHLALRIAGETLFSADLTGDAAAIGEALTVGMDEVDRLIHAKVPWPAYWPTPRNLAFWRAGRTLKRVTDALIAARRADGTDQPDLLGMMLHATDPESGVRLSDRALRDEVLTMLLAGHETTANGLTWTLHLLSQHPEVVERLLAEHTAVLQGRAPTAADYRALTYTEQVVKEALRLYPPVWIVERQAEADAELGGVRVPKGTLMLLSQWAMHRDPQRWSQPECFDPDRFGPDQPAPGRFSWFPFSRGQRQCIGDRFAMMEMVLVLATLVPRFRFTPGDTPPTLQPRVTLRPADGLTLHVHRR